MSHLPVFIPSLPKQFHWKIYGHVVHQQKKKNGKTSHCVFRMYSGHVLTTLETARLKEMWNEPAQLE